MMTTRKPVSALTGVTILVITAVAIIGWIANIVKLFHMAGGDITGELIIRAIGIPITPLGSVLGFL